MYEMKKVTSVKQEILPYNDKMKEKFLMINKDLFYTGLSVEEIIVYAYLKDKRALSQLKANQGDFTYCDYIENDVFCVVSNQELMDFMKIKGKPKIINIKKNLENMGLIKQVRQFDNSNKIFVYDYDYEHIEK